MFSINCKIYMLKDWHKSKMFLHVQSTQTSKVDNPCVFSNIFFLKLEKILTLIIIKAKGFELMKKKSQHIWIHLVQNVFDPKTYGFWNGDKKCSCWCDKRHECINNMI